MRLRFALRTSICSVALQALAAAAHAQEPPSPPPDKLGCIDAHRQAQIDERDGKLVSARRAWGTCAQEVCPDLVRRDCATGLAELTDKLPSIVITVREKGGASVASANVTLDGKTVAASALARPLDVDPGTHVLTAGLPDGRRAERRFTIAPGEQQVAVIAELDPIAASETPAAAPSRPVPPAVYVLGGVAVVGLATFVGFGIAGKNNENCERPCSEDEIDAMNRQYLIADIGLAAAVIAGGAATYFYLSRPERPGAERAFVRVRALPNGAGLSIGAEL